MKVAQISESDFTVQGHGVHTAFVETINGLEKIDGVTVLRNSQEPADIRHIHSVGPYALKQLLFRKGKKVVSAHIVPDSLVGSLVGAKYWKPLARWYLRWFYNRGDLVIAVSDTTKQILQKMGVTSRIEVVYNMIDISRYATVPQDKTAMREKYGFKQDDYVVVSNGQVQPRKRVDLFVEAAQKLPDIKFVWIGGIPFKNAAAEYKSMKKIMSNAPSNVTFTGVVSLTEVKQYFQTADVFVMPSDQETFGLAIIEAAATGLPVVLRDIPDYDFTFRPDAMVVEEHGFADAITQLRTDKRLYDDMVDKAHVLAERYDSMTIAQRLVTLYGSLLD